MKKKKTIIVDESLSGAERAGIDAERRRSDRVHELPSGFSMKSHGRDGIIYYRDGDRILELSYEMDGTRPGILLYIDGIDTWALPQVSRTSPVERERIRAALDEWLCHRIKHVSYVTKDELIRPWENGK